MPHDQEYGGPWLATAVFCEKVLIEKDGVPSIIRVVDRIMMTASGAAPPEKMPLTTLNVTAFIALKSGFAKGNMEIKLIGHKPSQQVFATTTLPVFLEGDEHGANAVLEVAMQVNEDGLYWFDVLIGERLVTRMPLRVVYQRLMSGPGTGLAQGPP